MDIIIAVIAALVSVCIGLALGALPLQASKKSDSQQRFEQGASVIGVAIVVLLIVGRQDTASWVAIIALAAGVGIAKIPPVNRFLVTRFTIFAPPSKPKTHTSGASSAKRR